MIVICKDQPFQNNVSRICAILYTLGDKIEK